MIGLSGAKEVIQQALDYYKAQKAFRDRGLKLDTPSMHMVFTGNPGTAKTTVARLFARIIKENGILSQGNLIEVGRGDLVGKYVGWTATRTPVGTSCTPLWKFCPPQEDSVSPPASGRSFFPSSGSR